MLIYYLKNSFDSIIVTMVPDKNPFKTERSFEQRCGKQKQYYQNILLNAQLLYKDIIKKRILMRLTKINS